MKITRVLCRLVDLPLPAPFHPAWARGRNQANILMVLVSLETDAGITGHTAAHAGLEAAVTVERFVAPYLIGQDPMRIERLTGILRDAEILGPPSYFMEVALWDIVGKQAGLPVYLLWGGAQDRVRAYCATAELRSPEQRVEDVHRVISEGYRGVKLRFHHDDVRDDLKVVEAIRKAVGDRIEIMIDANQAGIEPGLSAHRIWGFQRALAVARELEQLGVNWLEEPLTRYDHDGLARLRDRLDRIRIAGGEDNHGLHEFKQLIDRGCFDILQPDALLSEGVFQLRKVAAMAEAANLEIAPHTWGNGMGLLANLHLAAASPNCGWLEFPHDPPSGYTASARDQMLRDSLQIDANGDVAVPDLPGFGFLLDEDRITHHTVASFG
jgi:L-alanine-DL-glutamate epimerase-like enolase superfamily enzyme